MIWLLVFLVAITTVYLFSCWQVNQAITAYYKLKDEWDYQIEEGYYHNLGMRECGDIHSLPLTVDPNEGVE